MKTEKEIGIALEKKLQGAHRSPSPDMWEKINGSLDKKDRRRKIAFWLWGAGILIIALTTLYVATSNNDTQNKIVTIQEIDNNQTKTNASEIKNTQEITTNETLKQENVTPKGSKETDGKTINSTPNKMKQEVNISAKESTLKISEDKVKSATQNHKKTKERVTDEQYKVTKSYRYYNSKTKEEIVTENKKMMDSVIEKNMQLQKSLDSIKKLNAKIEKKKDSI
ncbi:hypothetical protein ULMS_25280 [Patiriisocius marinistellae]|uniref:Uncharacterized protein n=1 Tax=Patiriisocius marinistellae TaxID=2494560 RepID=A0A5J4FXM4_9FLAO|nr:hypothetical protein [Patiriisocius marinistellae]GEQ87020.1 hypothetical protein ULMS_25280 [Patiriisocius marinistellae]